MNEFVIEKKPSLLSITPDQRKDFGRWSDAVNKLDDATKEEEAESWIASAMSILNRHSKKGCGL